MAKIRPNIDENGIRSRPNGPGYTGCSNFAGYPFFSSQDFLAPLLIPDMKGISRLVDGDLIFISASMPLASSPPSIGTQDLVRGALEALVSALTPTGASHGSKSDYQPSLMNSDLLSRESENISLLLSMLTEDDFYVRYYTLQLLTALLTNSPSRLQEAILTTPHGVTRLMDMLMDREVIRNEALLLLTYLTREAQEIQKIIVFEGAFEKVFSIINEEGGSEGGVVVQDCLDLLNNILRNNGSNQILLRETIGFEPLISILKLRKGTAYNFTQQKTVNLLGALETVQLLLRGGLQADGGKEAHKASNQTVFAQMKMLDHLLMLGVESRWAPIAVRCMAMYCIGDMIAGHIQNRDMLANKVVGEEPHVEPALNSVLRVLLRTAADQEFVAADYVFKCFCKGNPKGQLFLSSTVSAQLPTSSHDVLEKDLQLPFGSLLMYGLVSGEATGNIETCYRAANVLSHILEDNLQCKQQFLRLEPDASVPSLVAREPILHRIFKCLALSSSKKQKADDGDGADRMFYQPFIIKLFITWLINCPDAVNSFLSSAAHLTYIIEILLVPGVDIFIQGLAAVLLGVCVVYNKSSDDNRDAYMVVNTISQRIGLTQYFLKFEVLKKSPLLTFAAPNLPVWRPLTRSASSEAAVSLEMPDEDSGKNGHGAWKPEHPLIGLIFDSKYLDFIKQIELSTRERVMQVYSQPKSKVSIAPAALQQKDGESDKDYIARLKSFIEKQCIEMQDLLGRNAALAEDLTKGGVSSGVTVRESSSDMPSGRERVQIETLRQEVEESHLVIESLKSDKAKFEADASDYQQMAAKIESDLKSLSNAYNSLERANFQLEAELKALRSGKGFDTPDLESVRAEAREEAQKESEAELNDLLVCLGQEQSKVERLSTRLTELGEDVDVLLEGIGDESALQEGGGDDDFDFDDE